MVNGFFVSIIWRVLVLLCVSFQLHGGVFEHQMCVCGSFKKETAPGESDSVSSRMIDESQHSPQALISWTSREL